MKLTRIADAEFEPISLSEVKQHLRVSGNDDDSTLSLFTTGVRYRTETYLQQTLVTTTWELKLDEFADITLPMGPIQSITSITYIDPDGVQQTLDPALYEFDSIGKLQAVSDTDWVETKTQLDAVTITYVAGNDEISPDIKMAMLLDIGTADLAREGMVIGTITSSLPESSKMLLAPYRRLLP